jgi:hypothetical protein
MIMRKDELFRIMTEASLHKLTRPPQEWFDQMAELGVLNEKGEVLIRMPEPPNAERNGAPSAESGQKPSSNHVAE